ncbi:hypothetical protein GCM10010270_42670 [Streptomyces violaceus]|nr:hypothetical protein GCM10010270_42670 [Streptomyces janthinus]
MGSVKDRADPRGFSVRLSLSRPGAEAALGQASEGRQAPAASAYAITLEIINMSSNFIRAVRGIDRFHRPAHRERGSGNNRLTDA